MLANMQAIHGEARPRGLIIAVGERGTARHWDGDSWRLVATRSAADLTAVHVVSATEAYAVGTHGTLIRWNGQTWDHLMVDTESDLYAIGGKFPHMWLGGGGVIFHWTAPDKDPELCVETNEWARAIWTPPDEPHRPFVLTNHTLTRWDLETGADPVDMMVPAPRGVFDPSSPSHAGARSAELYAMAASSPNDLWITGNGAAYHWNGQSWATRLIGAEAVYAVSFAQPGEAVAVTGCGRVLLWTGDDWRERKAVKRTWLSGVFCQDGVAFAVGQHGTLFSIRVAASEFQELNEYFDPVIGGWLPVWRADRPNHSSVYDPNFHLSINALNGRARRPTPPPRMVEEVPILPASEDCWVSL